ncbi:hypothetical protein ACFX2K_029472 [Malus domestica]
MADAIVSVLLERLASATFHYIEDKVENVLNVKKYVQEFTSNLKAIQAVLQDAERRQVEDESVRNWLDSLKEISYQMGDVLDEWNYDLLRQQVEKQEREGAAALVPEKKVRFSVTSGCFCFGQVSQVFIRHDIAARIKELNESLTLIYKQRKMYGFHIEKGTQRLERRITSSFVDVSNIFGRENEKDVLITKLLTDSSEQDYLNSKGNKDKEMIGQTYFDNLVARSFFQDFEKDHGSGKVICCKMHDIVHDFLQFLTKNECLIIEGEGATDEIAVLGDKVRHLTLASVPEGPLSPAISSSNCKNLHTFTTFKWNITTISSEFILQLKCLRTLNLSGEWIDGNCFEELPEEIGQLIHLKHIDLSLNDGLKKLPDAICELYNLRTLRLFCCCSLAELPDNMRKLISLKHLYIEGCFSLKYLPKGIGRLTSLQTLDTFVVCCGDKEVALQFEDLRTLKLQGSLVVKVSGDVKDVSEVEKAQLWDQKKLFHLGINCRDMHYRQTKSSVEILNVLRPHKDLEALDILGHTGTAWPIWMASLNHLRIVTIVGWKECEFLPPLGKLPSLEILTVDGMPGVRKVGGEFLGIEDQTSFKSSPSLFPKLKELRLRKMYFWEEWEGVGGWKKEESEITIMPCLSYLEIYFCPHLKTLPDFLCKVPLQNLIVNRCSRILEKRCEEGSGEEWPKISHIPNIHFLSEGKIRNLMHPENRNWRTLDFLSR